MHMERFHSDSGQIIIESMIAITVVTVGLLGMFALLSRSLSLTRIVADQYVGANLASEGIELVKNIVDRNTIQFRPWNENASPGDYEIDYNDASLSAYSGRPLSIDTDGKYGYDAGKSTPFVRHITISWPSPDEIKVVSRVDWTTRGGATFDATVEDSFYNWRK